MSANLTLKDQTLPVKLPFIFTANKNSARAVGELDILRNDFSIGQGQIFSSAIVGFEVKLMVDITAEITK